ncbi:MAG TPA: porin [Steroidobacteraceae bacterium]|jgi:predicted porin/Sec-independent protein translocase protein TatA|nr:porin [Steroidobacteraceae bacterium]
MCGTTVLRSLVAVLAAVVVLFGYPGGAAAQAGSAQSADQGMQDRMRQMQQQIDELNRQLQQMKQEQAKTQQQVQATQQQATTAVQTVAAAQKKVDAADKSFNNFMKGFYGTLDMSIDGTTKGMQNMEAFGIAGCTGPGGTLPCTFNTTPKMTPNWGPNPFGRVGWMAMMASNGSNVGYRGTHKIDDSTVDFIYQVSTALNLAAAPGLQNTWTKQSNTVQGAIGLGDTYIGFQEKTWGKLKFGTMYMPYKTSTDRLNPFAGGLGDYAVVMGNTGGDNRIEFGTRADHVVLYNSPTWQGVSFDAAYQFGQNPDPYNNIVSLGGTDCYGGNLAGSGNLPLNCDDGGYNYGYSFDIKYELGGLYLTAAYELHGGVNRSSDGVGSNNPQYGALLGPPGPNGCATPAPGTNSLTLLNWTDYNTLCAEFPGAAAAGTPEYNAFYDTANEYAFKVGGQYTFPFGLSISYIWEELKRNVPFFLEYQNERQRTGDWVALDYNFNGGKDRVAAGWAHAGASEGDPGGQHNFNPYGVGQNTANMYTVGWWHKLDKQLTWYLQAADTVNNINAHYDIGAGGHGIKTDCHDATHPTFIDYSSFGPTTWGGCHPIGVSTGVNFKF